MKVARLKRWLVGAAVLTIIVAAIGVAVWMNHVDTLKTLKHETNRWAVIQDVNGDKIAVEPVNNDTWSELVQLHQNGTKRFVGGIVEKYDNKWGFRFKPNTVTVAEVTAEGLQATIRYISENINDWLNGWAYVSSKVIETHSE